MRAMVTNLSHAINRALMNLNPPDQRAPFHEFDPKLLALPHRLQNKDTYLVPQERKGRDFAPIKGQTPLSPCVAHWANDAPLISLPKTWAHYGHGPNPLGPLSHRGT